MAFFDSVGKKLTQAGQDALQKTKDIADIAKINSLISDEEKRLNNNYYQIGKLYAQLHSSDCEEGFSYYINEVTESLKKIEELKANLQVLKAIAICPKCGAEVPTSSMFCNACGSPMHKPEVNNAAPPADSVKCSNCGNFVNKNMKFCTSCGTPIQAVAPVVESPVVESPVVESPVVVPQEDVIVIETPVEETVVSERRCSACGALVDADAIFCEGCGARL